MLQDTSDASGAVRLCRHADCVVHEATFEASMQEDALRKGHSTSLMAARFAAACGASEPRKALKAQRSKGSEPCDAMRMAREALLELAAAPASRCRAAAFLDVPGS